MSNNRYKHIHNKINKMLTREITQGPNIGKHAMKNTVSSLSICTCLCALVTALGIHSSVAQNAPEEVTAAQNVMEQSGETKASTTTPEISPVPFESTMEAQALMPNQQVSQEEAVEEDVEVLIPTPFSQEEEAITKISISLDDVTLKEAVRMFTRLTGANIVTATDTNMMKRVTVNMQDVEWKAALSAILDTHSLQLIEKIPDSEVYSIVEKQPGAPEPMFIKTFTLKYADPNSLTNIVPSMMPEGGQVIAYPEANILGVRATAKAIKDIEDIVKKMDQPIPQVMLEAKFVELNDQAIKDLGINWEVMRGYRVGIGDLEWSYSDSRVKEKTRDSSQNNLDSRYNRDTINEFYDMYDDQYEDESTEYEEVPPDSGNIITETRTTPTREIVDGIDSRQDISRTISDTFTRTISDLRTATLSADAFQLTLSALQQNDGVSIVSNPKMIIANQQTAQLLVGRKDPELKSNESDDGKRVTYERSDWVESGVLLKVTPIVNTEDIITLMITPSLSRVIGYADSGDVNIQLPILSVREIQTVFKVPSGQTAVIGGLTETKDQEIVKKVPLLGDIPLIGKYLFRHTHKEKLQDEIIIFVTVELAEPETLEPNEGIPENSRLIFKHLAKQKELQKEMSQPVGW